jgi:hypothetical protein
MCDTGAACCGWEKLATVEDASAPECIVGFSAFTASTTTDPEAEAVRKGAVRAAAVAIDSGPGATVLADPERWGSARGAAAESDGAPN